MNIAELGIRISSEDASGAAADLDKLTAAGGRAQKSTDQLSASADKASRALGKQRDELADLLGEIDPTVRALGRLDELEKRLAQQRKLGSLDAATFSDYQSKIAQSRESLARFDDSLTRTGNTAKQTAAAMRNVPAQFTDIVVSLQAGQNPLQVFLQQGGQLKDMFGGIGPAASALGGYVMGLVNPFTVAAAAAAVLGLAYYQASEETEAYQKALILSGNAAGTTADQLAETAKHISNVVGTTGQAAAALVLMAQSGKIAAENMEQIGVAAVSFSKATGTAIEDVVAQYVSLGKEPVEASRKLNEQYGYLTASVYQQIVALEEQGEKDQAAALAQTALADAHDLMATRVKANLSLLGKAWSDLGSLASSAWDKMLGLFRENTLQERIDKLRKLIKDREELGGYDNTDFQRQLKGLEGELAIEQKKTKEQAEQRKQREDAVSALDRLNAKAEAGLDRQAKKQKELDQLSKDRATSLAQPGIDKAQIERQYQRGLAEIENRYKDPKTRTRTRRSAVDLTDLNDEQNARKALVSSYANSQKELEAQQKAGLITQEDYYRQRVVLIAAEKEQVAAAYQGEIDALEQVKARSTTSAEQRIQLDQKIADARANMVKAQKEADSELSVLALNEQGRLKKQEESVRTYTDALQQQVTTLREQGQRAAATLGMGDRQQSLYASQNAITDRFNTSRRDLADQYADGSRGMSLEEYQRKLEALQATENDMRDTVVKNYDDMTAAQGDWRSGASSAWHNYLEDAQNVAGQAKTAFTSLYDGITDAVVEWAAGSDQKFGDVAASFAKMIAKMALQASVSSVWTSIFGAAVTVGGAAAGGTITSGFTYGLGSASAGLTYGGGRAVGGQVSGGSFYQVNEKGPELLNQGGKSYLMMGGDGGSITPLTSGSNAATAAGGTARAVEVTVIVNSDGGVETKTNEQSWKSMGDEIGRFVDARIRENEARSLSSQGNIRRAINGRA